MDYAPRPPLTRLIMWMAIGAAFGLIFISDIILRRFHLYDHGFGEGERCQIAGTVIGALLGLGVEAYIRACQLRSWRFSVRNLFAMLTLVAIWIGVFAAVVRWAMSTPPWQ